MVETLAVRIAKAVEEGLFREDKYLPSWLFYDDRGDRIFQEIMHMPEYYLTRCEFDIFTEYKDTLLKTFSSHGPFQLIELGAGDGLKTEVLLKHFYHHADVTYMPVDISAPVLAQLQDRLSASLPALEIVPRQGDYHEVLRTLSQYRKGERKVFLFLGANIGNFDLVGAIDFLSSIRDAMNENDLLMVGFDLMKDEHVIRQAYDDAGGVTRRFNLNLLERLNDELDATFDLDLFSHAPTYNSVTGEAKSYLVSRVRQRVYIGALDKVVEFAPGERIYTEVSLKYNDAMLNALADGAGLTLTQQYYDKRRYFTDVVFTMTQ